MVVSLKLSFSAQCSQAWLCQILTHIPVTMYMSDRIQLAQLFSLDLYEVDMFEIMYLLHLSFPT